MGTQAVAGTKLRFSTAVPATEDAAGYAALTWVGEQSCTVTNIGDFGGKEFNRIDTDTVCDRRTKPKKGTSKWSDFTCEFLQDYDSPAQELLDVALDSDDSISIEIEQPDGTKTYFYGLVMDFKSTAGGPNDMYKRTLTIAPDHNEYIRVDPV